MKIITCDLQIELNTSTSDHEVTKTDPNSNMTVTTNLEVDHKLDSKNEKGNFDILVKIRDLYTQK